MEKSKGYEVHRNATLFTLLLL